MLAITTIGSFLILATGLPPAEMAEIVAERLSKLDRLVVEVDVHIYMCPLSVSPLEQTAWIGPVEPGDGGRRVLSIVRPHVLDESFVATQEHPIVTSFTPARAVRRVRAVQQGGRDVYSVDETPITPGTYTKVPLLQLFDLQVHESWIPGLNVMSLLRDHNAQLIVADEGVNTYAVTVHSESVPAGTWIEHYEFDLTPSGTPTRFRTVIENSLGFRFEREFLARAVSELNGAELVTDAVAITRNSVADNYEIDQFVVCSAHIDDLLTADDVLMEPLRRNAVVWTRSWPIDPVDPWQSQEYDDAGNLIASTRDHRSRIAWRQSLLPGTLACGLVGALCVAFVSSTKYRRSARV